MDSKKQGIFQIKQTFLTRCSYGEDIIGEIEKTITNERISTATLSLIGAVQKATFGYYDQIERHYKSITKNGSYEIISCWGNVSLKDERPMVHAHILFGDEEGRAFGGHLMSPTLIFAAELYIQELEGEYLRREYDKATGLFLWK